MQWLRHLPTLLLGALLGAVGLHLYGPESDLDAPKAQAPGQEIGAPSPSPPPESNSFNSATPSLNRAARPDLRDLIADLDEHDQPLLRAAAFTQLGYEAAGRDLDEAMQRIEAIADASGRRAFIKGLFTRVAEDRPPYEAIQRVKRLARGWETEGFKALISQWSGKELSGEVRFQEIYGQLLSSAEVSPDIKQAWMQAYRDHSARSDMLAEFGVSLVETNPEDALAMGQDLNGWERQEFHSKLAGHWMTRDPDQAWAWIQANPESINADTVPSALATWAQGDAQAAKRAFETLTDSEDRLTAAAALGTEFATSQGTRASIAWADSLSSPLEQEAAHEAIYEATPRGIGAVLDKEEGTLTVRDLLPNSPSQQAGLRKGDRIVEVDPGHGGFESLSSHDLQEAVGLIRGEPGSALRLRVLRTDGSVHILDLNRQQLVFDAPTPAPRGAPPESP